jgi:pimeloyl-ACP methyl ester carboxylesterase
VSHLSHFRRSAADPSVRVRRTGVLTLVTLLLLSPLVAAPSGQASDVPRTGGGTPLDWAPCTGYEGAECARMLVPLDHDDADGPKTPLRVLRRPATGTSLGTLFVNPGGPGLSATDFAHRAGELIGPGVAESFDIVGVEPRGVGHDPRARCRVPSSIWKLSFAGGYPIKQWQTRRALTRDRVINSGCRRRHSPITVHASTADAVRDMELVREALGEERVSFYGVSYGSIVGQTYATMFPDSIRAMVIDGVLNPRAWSGAGRPEVPVTYRTGSGAGAREALVSALRRCDAVGRSRCVLAGRAVSTWLRVLRAARRGELRVGRQQVNPQAIVHVALGALYERAWIRKDLIGFLGDAAAGLDRPHRATVAGRSWKRLSEIAAHREKAGPYAVSGVASPRARSEWYLLESRAAVCADARNPRDPRRWIRTAVRADRTQRWFGRAWTWESSLCARFLRAAGHDAFRGPWGATSVPMLLVSTTHDPATPIAGARAAARLFDGSVLLSVADWGHAALGANTCAARWMASYLVDLEAPPPGTVCRADAPLYP